MEFDPVRPLEQNLSKEKQTLIDIVEEYYNESGNALINDEFSLSIPAMNYTTYLATVLYEKPTEEAWRTVYRAFHFALEVNQLAGIPKLPYKPSEDFIGLETVEEMHVRLQEISNEFMSRNEALDVVVGRFMPEIDPSGLYADTAEIVIAITSNQLERSYYREISKLAGESWDGTLSELDEN